MSQSRVSVANANFQECNNEFFKSGCEQCGKTHECSLLDSGDVVYRHILQLRRPRYAFYCRFGNGKDIGLDPVGMGYVFSAFSWAYVIGQIPGGWLLDRFGSKRVYFWSIFIWSMFTLLQGFVDIFSGFGIIRPCLHCASWSGLLKRHLSLATAALLRPGFRRRKGERRCRFLTPPNTSQRLSSRRLWAG